MSRGPVLLTTIVVLATATVFVPTHGAGGAADPATDIRDLKLRDWEPKSMMATKTI